MKERHILHIDMNAFYCACHAAAAPHLYKGKPTAVAGSPETRHGVVVTASYEARRKGVKATMTVMEAKRVCPNVIFIAPDFELYRKFSKRAFEVVRSYTPQIEIFSIDECWADITGSGQFGTPVEIANSIQQRLLEELHLPCSIGVGSNKFLTKMASDFKKPLGVTELWQEDVANKLWPLPIGAMFGVGGSSEARFKRMGVHTIGDLAQMDVVRLARSFGKRALELIDHANGRDDSRVNDAREPLKSVGHSITLSRDISQLDELNTVLLNLSDQVGRRLRHHILKGRTIQITIRFADRKTVTRARTLTAYTDLTEQIYETACELLMAHKPPQAKVRLLGVTITGLCPKEAMPVDIEPNTEQLSLFDFDLDLDENVIASPPISVPAKSKSEIPTQKLQALTKVTDELRDKYGENIVLRGRMLRRHQSDEIRDFQKRGTSLQKDKLT